MSKQKAENPKNDTIDTNLSIPKQNHSNCNLPKSGHVLLLTGACGVGKSTTAHAWAKKHQGAVIECDYFTEWLHNDRWEQFSQAEEEFVIDITVNTAAAYLKESLPLVIDNVWTVEGLMQLQSRLLDTELVTNVQCIYLWCAVDENHRRDEMRVPENRMYDRVDIVNQQLSSYQWPHYVKRVDTTKLTVPETIQVIDGLSP